MDDVSACKTVYISAITVADQGRVRSSKSFWFAVLRGPCHDEARVDYTGITSWLTRSSAVLSVGISVSVTSDTRLSSSMYSLNPALRSLCGCVHVSTSWILCQLFLFNGRATLCTCA